MQNRENVFGAGIARFDNVKIIKKRKISVQRVDKSHEDRYNYDKILYCFKAQRYEAQRFKVKCK